MKINPRQSKWRNRGRTASAASCLAMSAFLCSLSTAQAALMSCDDPTFGPNMAVCDTSTGLEWLKLTKSQGESANQVLAQLGPGGQFAGFQYADRNEFVNLFTEVFGKSLLVNPDNGLDLNATENFANLFGPTGSESINGQMLPTIAGLFDVTPNPGGSATLISFSYGPNLVGSLGGGSDTDSVSPL